MTMLAARIHGHGGDEVLRLDDVPVPERKPGDLLIRMIAAGLNRVDLYMRNSGAGITHRLPIILGLDGAGVIEEADAGSSFRAGDPVIVYPVLTCGHANSAAAAKTCCVCRRAFSASTSTEPSRASSAFPRPTSSASRSGSTSSRPPRSASPGSPPGA